MLQNFMPRQAPAGCVNGIRAASPILNAVRREGHTSLLPAIYSPPN